MKYGLYDAKNNLSRLVREVAETGIPVTITSRGEDMVEVVPVTHKPNPLRNGKGLQGIASRYVVTMNRKEAITRILAGGVGADLSRAEVVSLVEEGRP